MQVHEYFISVCNQVCTFSYHLTSTNKRNVCINASNKMLQRTQFTWCVSTSQITVIYTSLGLSGCKSNQHVTAFERSCSLRFTTTYTKKTETIHS